MKKKYVTVSTKIPEDLAKELEQLAKDTRTTPSRIIRNVIEEEVDEKSDTPFRCDKCRRKIQPKEDFLMNSDSIMEYGLNKKGKPKDEPKIKTTIVRLILCENCFKKLKLPKN